jgi:carbamoyl-phosphate synthase large subunit
MTDKRHLTPGKELVALGFRPLATRGTAAASKPPASKPNLFLVNEGRPNIVDLVKTGKSIGHQHAARARIVYDEKSIRRAAIRYNIPCITTLAAAHAAARGIRALHEQGTEVAALQDLHKGRAAASSVPASGD